MASEKKLTLSEALKKQNDLYGTTGAFERLLDFMLFFFNLSPTDEDKKKIKKIMESDDRKDFVSAMGVIGDQSEGFEDALGKYYEQEITKGKNGQYFTPMDVASLANELTNPDSNGLSYNDPACGSGRMFLAAAKRLRIEGKGYGEAHFTGADIDITCCKMTVLNMLLNTMCGEILHGDTLRMKFTSRFRIGKVLCSDNHWIGFYQQEPIEQKGVKPKRKKTAKGTREREE